MLPHLWGKVCGQPRRFPFRSKNTKRLDPPSVAAGSNQSVAIKQAICAAYNLSCSGTGPSGLARITAATHPQTLVSDSQELSQAGCRWVGRAGEKKVGWEVTSVCRVTATSARVGAGTTPPALLPTAGVARATGESS